MVGILAFTEPLQSPIQPKYPVSDRTHIDAKKKRKPHGNAIVATPSTYLLLLGLIVRGVPLLRLVRGVDDLAGRRTEGLRRSPGRHCENLSKWGGRDRKGEQREGKKSGCFENKIRRFLLLTEPGFRLVSSRAPGDFVALLGILSRGGEEVRRFVRSRVAKTLWR